MSSGIDMSFVLGKATAGGKTARPRGGSGDTFRVLVIADLSGRGSRREAGLDAPTFTPQRIDLDSFDRVFERLAPMLHVAVRAEDGSVGHMPIRLERLEDFEPDRLLLDQPVFARLRDLRTRLSDASTFEQAAAELRAGEADRPAAVSDAAQAPAGEDDSATLERLLGRPAGAVPAAAATRGSASDAESAVDRLIRAAVAPHIVADRSAHQRPLVDSLDRTIGDTMRSLLRDPHWRTAEGAWNAIDRFVRTVEMDGAVRLELVDASAADVLESLVAAEGDPQRMPLAQALATGQRDGGDPACAVIVALYPFGAGAAELALLAALGAVAAQQGAVLLAGADSALALIDSPPEFDGIAAAPADADAATRWRTLRSSALAPHVGLVWPRVLTRLPYGARSQPVSAFQFEELADGAGPEGLSWRVAALDLAGLLASAFVADGWDLQPAEAVELDDLPGYIDRNGDEPRLQAVAELYLSERQARAVASVGVMPLVSDRGQPRARLGVWRSIGVEQAALAGRWSGR